jgi:phosphocarrier protein
VKLVRKVRVTNALGLHTRPATQIVRLLQNCKSSVNFLHKKESINAKSILSILMLAAKKNSQILVTVEGEDAEDVMDQLVMAFESGFGE